jgi:hypothetical protein
MKIFGKSKKSSTSKRYTSSVYDKIKKSGGAGKIISIRTK